MTLGMTQGRSIKRSALKRTGLWALVVTTAGLSVGACASENDPLPDLPDIQRAEGALPALSGGTLMVTKDGAFALASDPDRDRVSVVHLAKSAVEHTIELDPHDEPGRLIEDGAGRVHIALRGSGDLISIVPTTGEILERTPVCGSPRGVAFDASEDTIVVACAGGLLVTLDAASHDVVRSIRLDRDLRDVVMVNGRVHVTRFRTAELLEVAPEGEVVTRRSPASHVVLGNTFVPNVAWRAIPLPSGDGVAMVHQRALDGEITNLSGAYYAGIGCENSVVEQTVTVFRDGEEAVDTVGAPAVPLSVDVAVSPDGSRMFIASAGSSRVITVGINELEDSAALECDPYIGGDGAVLPAMPVAVAYTPTGARLVQTREPATLRVYGSDVVVDLGGKSVRDDGFTMFHTPPQGGFSPIACASCHPEGGDDAHTWSITDIGPRRTQTLRGGIMATAPLHWDGSLKDMDGLMDEVFVSRMGGTDIGPRYVGALEAWMDKLPASRPAPSQGEDAIERGRALFEDSAVKCATCHTGSHLTDNRSYNVGTGREFQVPMLIGVADRAPFMHDGCAETLLERFTNVQCGGGDQHGVTSQLSDAQLGDLVAYLESL